MDGELFIPLTFFVVTGAVLWKFFDARHRERMTMIEKGVSPGELKDSLPRLQTNPLSSLKWGLLALFVGLGLIAANWLDRVYLFHDSVYFAGMLVAGGVGLVIFYFIASKKIREKSD